MLTANSDEKVLQGTRTDWGVLLVGALGVLPVDLMVMHLSCSSCRVSVSLASPAYITH